MTEAEELLVKIKFVVDMYNSGANTAGSALRQILHLTDERELEED